MHRLRGCLQIDIQAARNAALHDLTKEIDPASLADLLGYSTQVMNTPLGQPCQWPPTPPPTAQQSVRELREYVRTWYHRYPVNCRIFVNVLYPNLFSGLQVCR
jgi:hypothetical protein